MASFLTTLQEGVGAFFGAHRERPATPSAQAATPAMQHAESIARDLRAGQQRDIREATQQTTLFGSVQKTIEHSVEEKLLGGRTDYQAQASDKAAKLAASIGPEGAACTLTAYGITSDGKNVSLDSTQRPTTHEARSAAKDCPTR